jgi:hypothetical protein
MVAETDVLLVSDLLEQDGERPALEIELSEALPHLLVGEREALAAPPERRERMLCGRERYSPVRTQVVEADRLADRLARHGITGPYPWASIAGS